MWTTTGTQADWMCLLAITSEGPPHQNKSLICLPMNTKGISTKKIEKMGNHSSDTAVVFFEDVVVPQANIIGEEGMGFTYQMLQFQEERMWGTASSEGGREGGRRTSLPHYFSLSNYIHAKLLSLTDFLTVLVPLQRCLQQTIDYTRDRKAFGKSILDNQVVHFRLAELETELELLRSLLHRTISE